MTATSPALATWPVVGAGGVTDTSTRLTTTAILTVTRNPLGVHTGPTHNLNSPSTCGWQCCGMSIRESQIDAG